MAVYYARDVPSLNLTQTWQALADCNRGCSTNGRELLLQPERGVGIAHSRGSCNKSRDGDKAKRCVYNFRSSNIKTAILFFITSILDTSNLFDAAMGWREISAEELLERAEAN